MSLGVRKFTLNETLTSDNVNEYLMQQTVMVFDSDAARTTAFASAGITITEGMVTYLRDTNVTQYYDGSNWIALGAGSSDPMNDSKFTAIITMDVGV
jgi:hypothetical protein